MPEPTIPEDVIEELGKYANTFNTRLGNGVLTVDIPGTPANRALTGMNVEIVEKTPDKRPEPLQTDPSRMPQTKNPAA